jgi:hypothetical protein
MIQEWIEGCRVTPSHDMIDKEGSWAMEDTSQGPTCREGMPPPKTYQVFMESTFLCEVEP